MNNIIRVFQNTDMRKQHDGLAEIAKAKKVNIKNLNDGEHVVFLNSKLDRLKLFSANGVLSYYHAPSGRINLAMIEMIPKCFGASGMDWNAAEKLAIDKLLGMKT